MTNGLSHLTHLGLLKISGADAKTFLQGQVTCHLDQITPSQSRLAAHCNLKGRMQSLSRVLQISDEHYYLSLPLSMVPLALQHFKKYAMFSKVTLEDATESVAKMGVLVANTNMGVHEALATMGVHEDMAVDECITKVTHDGFYTICKIPGTRFEIIGTPTIVNDLERTIVGVHEKQAIIVGVHVEANWELLDIRAGIPTVYPATVDVLLPHHVNLSVFGGINYNKGCYLGQEIISRMHYKGNIKKHMYCASVEGTSCPLPGDRVFIEGTDNEAPGIVVRASNSTADTYECLVVIEDALSQFQGAHLLSSNGPALTPLVLPYSIS